jgi:predicted GNAT family N-acyltransferase
VAIQYRDGSDVGLDSLAELRAACDFHALPRDTLQGHLTGSRWVISAWDGDRLVGFARAISDGITNAYVGSVMVHGDYRRSGIGRTLILRLVEGRGGIRWVLHARAEAMAFYASLGFVAAPDMMWRDRESK